MLTSGPGSTRQPASILAGQVRDCPYSFPLRHGRISTNLRRHWSFETIICTNKGAQSRHRGHYPLEMGPNRVQGQFGEH